MASLDKKWGELTVERHMALQRRGIYLHVFYKGQDVTRRCMFADDTNEGMAELYIPDADGKPYVDSATGRPATQIVYGVTFLEGEPLS